MTTSERKKVIAGISARLDEARNDTQELRDDVDTQTGDLSDKQREGEKGEKLSAIIETLEDAIGQIEEAQSAVEGIEW